MANSDSSSSGVGCGFLGVILAVIISWSKCKLIGYTILHAFAGWLYVIYALCNGYVKF